MLGRLAAFGDPMVGGRRHQQDNAQDDHPETRKMHNPRAQREVLESLRHRADELEAEECLRPRQHYPGLDESIVDLLLQRCGCCHRLTLFPGIQLSTTVRMT